MHLRSTLAVRRIGVAVTALALGMGMSTPSSGAPAKDKATDCIDYGDVTAAPAGTIPRDDLHVVHKDPLAGALKSAEGGAHVREGQAGLRDDRGGLRAGDDPGPLPRDRQGPRPGGR